MTPLLRRNILSLCMALAVAAGVLCTGVAHASYEAYYRQFGARKVPVQLRVPGGATQEWFLNRVDGDMVEIALANGDAMALNATEPGVPARLVIAPVSSARLSTLLNARNYEAAANLIRPAVYPLLKFSALPPSFTQVYDPIDILIGTLVDGGELVEAAEILRNNPALLSQERFQRRIFGLIEGLASQDENEEAVRLLQLIPMDQVPQGLKNVLLAFAYKLRVQGQYAELIPIYEQIIPMLEGAQKEEAQIWLAYCLINTGRQQEGQAMLEQMPEPKPGEDGFGLYQLLRGYNLYRAGQFAQALDVFSRGLVYASSVDVWIPEVSFYIGNCYRELGKTAAARGTYEEIFRLHPANPWAIRARAAYDEMAAEAAAARQQPAS